MGEAAALLFKCRADAMAPGAPLLRTALADAAALAAGAGFAVERLAAYRALSVPEIYAYLWLSAPRDVGAMPLPDFGPALAGMPAILSPLQRVDRRAGASRGADAPFHYVVEFDVEDGYKRDVDQWYDQEHLGGLAAVPGVTGAQRFYNLGAGLWSYACYDMVSLDTHDSPPWYAIRCSDWSARVRPHFVGTKRTKFSRLFDRTL